MDFTLDEQQTVIQDLARQILGREVTNERHRALEASDTWFDRNTWKVLADAGLIGAALPEAHGGLGLGFVGTALVMEEVGRTSAKLPYAGTAIAAEAIARFGTGVLAERWLPRTIAGDAVLGVALAGGADAVRWEGGDTLEGTVSFVPDGLWAALVLVPAVDAAGLVRVYAVQTEDEGVSVEAQPSTLGSPDARLVLRGVPGIALDGDGSEIAEFLRLRSVAALCAYAAGVAEAALTLTAGYVREREQFGKPLATFQAVSQRAADTYTDARAIRLTARQAAWRLGGGLPATMDVAVAKFWACDGGHRVAFATQHLHGGMGVDRDYPLHRYFHAMRRVDVTLGGATEHLLRIGAELAEASGPTSNAAASATAEA